MSERLDGFRVAHLESNERPRSHVHHHRSPGDILRGRKRRTTRDPPSVRLRSEGPIDTSLGVGQEARRRTSHDFEATTCFTVCSRSILAPSSSGSS